jgi:hypothetical protein
MWDAIMEMAMQCVLRTPTGGCLATWLPAEHAVPGRQVSLKLAEGGKSPPMTVAVVYALALPMARIRAHERDWTKSTDYVRGRARA